MKKRASNWFTTIGDRFQPEPDGCPSSYDILPNGDVWLGYYDDPSPIVQYSSDGYILTIPAEVFSDSKFGVSAIIVNSGRLYVLTNDYTLCSMIWKPRKWLSTKYQRVFLAIRAEVCEY